MRKAIVCCGVLVSAAAFAAWPTRWYWEMTNCPAGEVSPACVSAITYEACDGGASLAADGGFLGWTSGACTGTAKTLSTQGLRTESMSAFALTICAQTNPDGGISAYVLSDGGTATCTLSGAGNMLGEVYRAMYSDGTTTSAVGRWGEAPYLDVAVPSRCAGAQCCSFADLQTGSQADRVAWYASGVTVSCGTGLDVMIDGQTWPNGSH